jgi:regulator of sigma E protease
VGATGGNTLGMCLIAMMSWENVLWWLQVVPMVAIGLGAVIFVHELGHFLVAKACGVKCEKFMIGFDIGGYKLSRRWGETLYGIGIMPLGGYVKMLGQDDDPAHIAEQMQKSQVDAESREAVPIKGPSGETYYVDRRSYLAKSVPQRMAIISAGVIMNIIFAFIFAAIAYGMGVKYLPSIVSETIPGSPAWQAGLEPGDEIVKIGDRVDPTFMQLMGGVTLGDTENGIPCEILRAADGQITSMTLKPKQRRGQLAMIGVSGPQSLVLHAPQPTIDDSPAAEARLVAPPENDLDQADRKLKSGDKIVQVGDTPVADYRGFVALLAGQPDQPLKIAIERPVEPQVARQGSNGPDGPETTRLTFEVPPKPLRDFGLVMKIGPITAVQINSPGVAAGLKAGDIIESVDGKNAGDPGGWTPDTFPDLMRQAAQQKRDVELVVLRSAKGDAAPERVTLRVTPRTPRVYYSGVPFGAPQGVEELGIAYAVTNEVRAVSPDGPASRTNIQPGDTIIQAKFTYPNDKDGKPIKPLTLDLGPDSATWTAVVDAVQFAPLDTTVTFTLAGTDKSEARDVSVTPGALANVFYPPRGFLFAPIEKTRTAATFAQQLRYGWDETYDALTMVVRFLRKIGTQVPATMLGGPGTIAAAAGGAASKGLSSLLIFLTMLSANLAVVNFLPIPLLDGGHMMFLAYEGLRGRPANERVVIALHTAGFVFIIGLMLFVIGLDIQRWIFT